jgi:hypothetical protein
MVLWSDYSNMLLITLCYVALCLYIVFMKSADEIKQNWSEYRCNPPYWIYSSNIASDMQYCVQNTMNSTKTATQNEFMSSITMLTDMAATFNEANLSNQESSSLLGDSLGNITGNIMGVFNNVTMSMTKIISGIINMTGEVIGIMITLLYIMDGSMKTMASLWAGPPGQAVRFIGSCFHKNTVLLVLEQNIQNHEAILIEGYQLDNLTNCHWDFIFSHREMVFARTTPDQKLLIVTEMQNRNHRVGVTGDGVNGIY